MIPLKDDIPSTKRPVVMITFIIINAVVYFYEITLEKNNLQYFLISYGAIPKLILSGQNLYTLITSMFLHGGFWHILGNMVYLWVFGDNIENAFGHIRFFFFYLFSGLMGSLLHILTSTTSQIPMVGASGAISGILGAYFILYPNARILTLVPIFYFIRVLFLPAYLFLGFWILLQFFSGFASLPLKDGGGVAWFAHIGGFLTGVIFALFIRKRIKKRRIFYDIY